MFLCLSFLAWIQKPSVNPSRTTFILCMAQTRWLVGNARVLTLPAQPVALNLHTKGADIFHHVACWDWPKAASWVIQFPQEVRSKSSFLQLRNEPFACSDRPSYRKLFGKVLFCCDSSSLLMWNHLTGLGIILFLEPNIPETCVLRCQMAEFSALQNKCAFTGLAVAPTKTLAFIDSVVFLVP